jgi:hypothetical protein
MFILDLSYK